MYAEAAGRDVKIWFDLDMEGITNTGAHGWTLFLEQIQSKHSISYSSINPAFLTKSGHFAKRVIKR